MERDGEVKERDGSGQGLPSHSLISFPSPMVLFEDPLTADLPSRLEREEEEAEAQAGAAGLVEPPLVLVRRARES